MSNITIHIGPMGSCKTEVLINKVKKIGRQNCILVCPPPAIDTRNEGKIVSRNKRQLDPDTYGIETFGGQKTAGKTLFIDEYHLMPAFRLGGLEQNGTLGIQSQFFADKKNFDHVHVFVINQVVDGYSHLKRLVTIHNPNIVYYGCTKSKNYHIRTIGGCAKAIMAGGDDMYKRVSEAEWLEQYLKGVLINEQ